MSQGNGLLLQGLHTQTQFKSKHKRSNKLHTNSITVSQVFKLETFPAQMTPRRTDNVWLDMLRIIIKTLHLHIPQRNPPSHLDFSPLPPGQDEGTVSHDAYSSELFERMMRVFLINENVNRTKVVTHNVIINLIFICNKHSKHRMRKALDFKV